MTKSVLGIIGGSGLYDMPGLRTCGGRRSRRRGARPPTTSCLPNSTAADPLSAAPRPRPPVPPSGINYRANIDALKRAGVTDLVSISACGSLKEELPPGHFVLVDQFIDRTFAREKSFFGPGCVAHVSDGRSGQPAARRRRSRGAAGGGIAHTPRRHLPRDGGAAVLDARREQSLPQLGLRRDRHDQHAGGQARPRGRDLLRHRRHGDRLRLLARRARRRRRRRGHPGDASATSTKAQRLVLRLARDFPREHPPCPIGSDRALDVAIITPPEARDPALCAKLDAVAGRVLNG